MVEFIDLELAFMDVVNYFEALYIYVENGLFQLKIKMNWSFFIQLFWKNSGLLVFMI